MFLYIKRSKFDENHFSIVCLNNHKIKNLLEKIQPTINGIFKSERISKVA